MSPNIWNLIQEQLTGMPVKVKKMKKGYRVSTPNGVKAKHTTKKKATAQKRLLNALDHGWKGKKAKKSKR